MNNENSILITGACGFVGRYLVNHLLEHNLYQKIIVCCHHQPVKQQLFSKDGRLVFVNADLMQPEKYNRIIATHNPNDIIHLAAIARFKQGEENPEDTVKANFFGTLELLKPAKQFNAGRFLYVSSNFARNPKGVTGVTKYLTEAYIKSMEAPPETISIRLPNVIDSPGAVTLIFKRLIHENKAITITDKRMTRKFITPRQAAKDLLFVLQNGNHGDLFINNKPSTPIIRLAEKMIAESGKDIPVKFIGVRPGEKLQEEDYPQNTILPTAEKNIFRLTENQHTQKNILHAVELLNGKISNETIVKIKTIFNLK